MRSWKNVRQIWSLPQRKNKIRLKIVQLKMGVLQNLIKGCKSPVFLYKFLFVVEKISNLEFIQQ